MIRSLGYLIGLLYCFVWLRTPDIAGVAFPLQRIMAWSALAVVLGHIALKGPLPVGPTIRSFLRVALLFLAFLLVNLIQKLAYGSEFHLLYFLMDFSKYVAIFTVAFIVYYALSSGAVRGALRQQRDPFRRRLDHPGFRISVSVLPGIQNREHTARAKLRRRTRRLAHFRTLATACRNSGRAAAAVGSPAHAVTAHADARQYSALLA